MLQVLPRVVVVHVPHDHGVACHGEVRRGRAVLHEQSHGAEPFPHVNDDGVAAARVDAPPRDRLAVALPQRLGHRHHQGPAERRREAERQREERQQKGPRHQALGQAGAPLARVFHHQEPLGGQGRRGRENRLVCTILSFEQYKYAIYCNKLVFKTTHLPSNPTHSISS
jgi:hypothetical protein